MSEQQQIKENTAGAPDAPAAGESPAALGWHRVHPLSPLAKFWVAVLAIIYVVGKELLEGVFRGGEDDADLSEALTKIPAILGDWSFVEWLILVGIVALVLGGMTWSWWFTQYQVTEQSVRVKEGALFRSDKQARLDRIQSIEITQPLFARLVGLAELRFEVADSSESTLHLKFLTRRSAEDLRRQLLGRRDRLRAEEAAADGTQPGAADAAGSGAAEGVADGAGQGAEAGAGAAGAVSGQATDAAASAEGAESAPVLVKIGAGRALGSVLTHSIGAIVALVIFGGLGLVLTLLPEEDFGLFALAPAVLLLISRVWAGLNSTMNFQLRHTPDGLVVRHGLSSVNTKTIPLGRIQAVGIRQPLLWRIPGWFRVELNIAGSGGEGGEDSSRVLLPVGTGQELMRVLPYVVENPSEAQVDGARLHAALEGSGDWGGFIGIPCRVWWLDPLTYRRRGCTWTEDSLWIRDGWLNRRLAVVPHARTQSAEISRGPLQSRLDVATVSLASLGGSVTARIRHLDTEDARELIRSQAERAAHARRIGRGA